MIGADVLGRLIQPGQEVPVGAMTALAGGPWLLYLAWKTAKRHSKGDRQMGGTLKPVKLPVVVSIMSALIVVVLALAFSYNGMSWSFDWMKPVVWNFRIPRVLTAFIVGSNACACRCIIARSFTESVSGCKCVRGNLDGWRWGDVAIGRNSCHTCSIYADRCRRRSCSCSWYNYADRMEKQFSADARRFDGDCDIRIRFRGDASVCREGEIGGCLSTCMAIGQYVRERLGGCSAFVTEFSFCSSVRPSI